MRSRLSFLLLLLSVGCGGGRSSYEQAEVSGTVYLRGKPLPGGMVTFLSDRGVSASAVIEPDGRFHIKSPLGEGKISIENRMLLKSKARANDRKLKLPADAQLQSFQGKYVFVPEKYHKADTSGLTFQVNRNTQALDVRLE